MFGYHIKTLITGPTKPLFGSGARSNAVRYISFKKQDDKINDELIGSTSNTKRRLNSPNAKSSKARNSKSEDSNKRGAHITSVKTKKTSKNSNTKLTNDNNNNTSSNDNNDIHEIATTGLNEATNNNAEPQLPKINQYIPFKNFPKAPDYIMSQSLDSLYKSIDHKPSNLEINGKKQSSSEKFVEFAIPDKYSKTKIKEQITEKDKAVVDEINSLSRSNDEKEINQLHMNVLKLYYDEDSNTYQPLPEHSLKKSLSGMINLNPHMEDIDDEYLWNLFPKSSSFGKPPFESKNDNISSFKVWEKVQLEKLKKEQLIKEGNEKEFKEFENLLQNLKTFFRKLNTNTTNTTSGGRRKLDRKLLKKYKKLKSEGKIPESVSYELDDKNPKF